jgi:hypothetical protein
MKRNRSISVWFLLSLAVVLFCLSVMAPREWSSWDAEPLGPALAASSPTVPAVQLVESPVVGAAMGGIWPGTSAELPQGGLDPCVARSDVACAAPGDPSDAPSVPAFAQADCDREGDLRWADEPLPTLEPLPTNTDLRSDQFSLASARNEPRAWADDALMQGSAAAALAAQPDAERPAGSAREASDSGPATARTRSAPHELQQTEPLASRGSAPRATASPLPLLPAWPTATALLAQLDELETAAASGDWCLAVRRRLERLAAADSLAAVHVAALLEDLESLAAEGQRRARLHPEPETRSRWARTAFAVTRRVAVWQQVHAIARTGTSLLLSDDRLSSLRQAYDALADRLRDAESGEVWERYLLMAQAKSHFFGELASDTVECHNLAKQIVLRAESGILTRSQQKFLEQPVCQAYLGHIRRLAMEPVDYSCLMAQLERYEQERSASSAVHIAAAQQILRWSDEEAIAELGRRLDVNYRNANLRIAIGRSFMERLLPPPEPIAERVDEIIQGAYTTGCSETLTELGVRLIPSPNTWRIGLVAQGQVATSTQSNSGPATFHSRGSSVFEAAKEVVIHRQGCYHRAAVADAQSSNELDGVSTRLDSLPLVGDLARAIAVDRYRDGAYAAEREVRQRVANTASDRIDQEVDCRLNEAQQRFLDHFYGPLRRLALNPMATDMVTTETDLVARLRLAGNHQLGAHTPRPTTQADSVFHLQVHESAANNLFEQLTWEGRRANVRDLLREIATHFQLPAPEMPEDLPDDVFVKFADQTPLSVAFQQDRLTLQLALAELSQGNSRWRDFTVRVHYRHAPEQPDADLVRDRYVELIGKRLHLRDQIALRGIFSRVFSQNKPIQLVSRGLRSDPRMARLQIDQLVMSDGWLSVSLGEDDARPDEDRTAQGSGPLRNASYTPAAPSADDTARAVLIRVRAP